MKPFVPHRLFRTAHRPRLLAVGGAVLLASFIGMALLARAADDKKAAAAKPALSVTVASPTKATLVGAFSASGNITAWQEAIVGAEVGGLRIEEVRADVGDRVGKGDVLVRFASETVAAEAAQAKAALAEAEAAAAEAQANAARAQSLDKTGALSAQQIEQYGTAVKVAAARLAAAQAAAHAAAVRLGHTQLRAPDRGTISARSATLGAVVNPGQELFRLVRGDRLEWRGEITAAEVTRVRAGQRVTVTTPSGATVPGKVRVIAPTADPATRNLTVYVDLERHPAARAGMFARGSFELAASEALTVPQQAVVVRDGFSHVFLIDDKNRATLRKVTTGRRDGERIEIVAGLDVRSRIAVKGAGFLADGDLVAIAPAMAAADPPARK